MNQLARLSRYDAIDFEGDQFGQGFGVARRIERGVMENGLEAQQRHAQRLVLER